MKCVCGCVNATYFQMCVCACKSLCYLKSNIITYVQYSNILPINELTNITVYVELFR